jgi:hypothetical protein
VRNKCVAFDSVLEELRDVANGKRRRFFNVSPKAAALFKQWLGDYHAAPTLKEVLDQYEMGHLLEGFLRPCLRYEGKRVVVESGLPPAPGEGSGFNAEVMYLVAKFVITANCEKLRLCPRCGTCYVRSGAKKFCSGLCGRRAATARIVGAANSKKRNDRIDACRDAYAKYQALSQERRELTPADEYVLREANRHLHHSQKIGGPKRQVNFITRNAEAIGIKKEEL